MPHANILEDSVTYDTIIDCIVETFLARHHFEVRGLLRGVSSFTLLVPVQYAIEHRSILYVVVTNYLAFPLD
jgi:hypothetical protein